MAKIIYVWRALPACLLYALKVCLAGNRRAFQLSCGCFLVAKVSGFGPSKSWMSRLKFYRSWKRLLRLISIRVVESRFSGERCFFLLGSSSCMPTPSQSLHQKVPNVDDQACSASRLKKLTRVPHTVHEEVRKRQAVPRRANIYANGGKHI